VTGITFRVDAVMGAPPLSLLNVLLLLGEARVAASTWQVRMADMAGEPSAAARLQRASDEAAPVAGSQILNYARAGVQLIDGELVASDPGSGPWVVVRAVDSSDWDVESDDLAVIAQVTEAIPAAQPLPL